MKGEATIQPPPLIEALHVISHIVSLCVLLHVDPVTRGTDIAGECGSSVCLCT